MSPIKSLIGVLMVLCICFVFVKMIHGNTVKVGEGPFVMAVSYTDSYNDLEYVANFNTCKEAEAYYYTNCINAPIMMCQLEEQIHMPISHETRNAFSKFDFEVDDSIQSCGFVKTQEGYSTFIEEEE